MLNDTPQENTAYTQYHIDKEDPRHVFSKQLENGVPYVLHRLAYRLCIQEYSVKITQTPTFFGLYYVFYDSTGVYLGVQHE